MTSTVVSYFLPGCFRVKFQIETCSLLYCTLRHIIVQYCTVYKHKCHFKFRNEFLDPKNHGNDIQHACSLQSYEKLYFSVHYGTKLYSTVQYINTSVILSSETSFLTPKTMETTYNMSLVYSLIKNCTFLYIMAQNCTILYNT